jgi:TusA-related sulfurtransferase
MTSDDEAHLDVCGVCCPLPLIQLAKAVKDLDPGQTLEITGNDPIFEASVRDYCAVNGHAILEVRPGDKRRVAILIRVGG